MRAPYFADAMPAFLVRLIAMTAAALALASCATGGGWVPIPDAQPPGSKTKIHRLSIGRVASAPLSNAQADAILAGATRVLRSRDSGSDVSADVVLQRRGDVRVIAGPAVIASAEDYARIGASGVQVAIVEAVRFCTATKPGILGCSHIGGSFMALVRRSSLEDIIWAHEYGHNCGLNHRNDPSALMYTVAGSSRRSLTSGEAGAYERKGSGRGSAAISAPEADADAPASAGEFLERVYVHGIPFSHVADFVSADAARFKAVLADPSRKAQWLNASVALGAIGTPDAVESVRGFVREGRGRLTHDAYQAKLGAVTGLGYGASRRAGGSALDELCKGCSLDSWRREVQWSPPGVGSRDETARELTSASFSGLALSGTDEAAKMLTAHAQETTQDGQLQRHAKRALSQLREVRKEGLRRYTAPRSH